MSEQPKRVTRAVRVVGRRVRGEMVLVRFPSLETRVLNEIGARVWELADGSTADEIARVIAEESGEPLARVGTDVSEFVDTLALQALLQID